MAARIAARAMEADVPLDPARLQRLDGFLGGVSPTLALQLARAVEIDRLRGGALPHDQILTALRPRLREAARRLDRTLTPRRLVCSAFEDLLVDARLRKQRGRVLRSSIDAVWQWLTRTLAPVACEQALDAIREKLLNGGPDFAGAEVDMFQRVAAEAILRAVPTAEINDARCGEAVRALGAETAADAYDMARMMEMAGEVRQMQRMLPKPMHTLHEEDIFRIRSVFDRVVASHPDCASYIPFLVMGRLDRPWEAIRLTGALSRKVNDTLISRTDFGAIGETLLSDLDDCIERLSLIRPAELNAASALANVVTFSNVSTGIVRELGIKRDGIWGRRMMHARGDMSAQMERLLARAHKEIAATLPTVRRGGFGIRAVRRAPDLTRMLDPQKAAKAVQLARLIAGSRQHATAGAFAGMLNQIDEQVTATVRQYVDDLPGEVHALGQAGSAMSVKFVDHAALLIAALDGPEAGEQVHRRANAALVISPPIDKVA
ncbi:MAG: hypothetical protein QM698_04965 [Micropepsaceae bacterium]